LNVVDGPYDASVVAVIDHSDSAFVDCGVGCNRGKKYGGGTIKVLGMLQFEDMVREGDEVGITAGDKIKVYIKNVLPQLGLCIVSL